MFSTTAQFKALQDGLELRIQTAAEEFLNSKGLPFNRADLDQMSHSPRDLATDMLMFGGNIWPSETETTSPILSNRSKFIRYTLWSVLILSITIPVAAALIAMTGFGGYLTLTIGVLAISLVFGSSYALVHGALASIANNIFIVHPTFQPTYPNANEIFYAALFVVFSLFAPWIAKRASRLRYLALAK